MEAVEYLLDVLFDELGLDADEAVEVLVGVIKAIAEQEGDLEILEDAANSLAD